MCSRPYHYLQPVCHRSPSSLALLLPLSSTFMLGSLHTRHPWQGAQVTAVSSATQVLHRGFRHHPLRFLLAADETRIRLHSKAAGHDLLPGQFTLHEKQTSQPAKPACLHAQAVFPLPSPPTHIPKGCGFDHQYCAQVLWGVEDDDKILWVATTRLAGVIGGVLLGMLLSFVLSPQTGTTEATTAIADSLAALKTISSLAWETREAKTPSPLPLSLVRLPGTRSLMLPPQPPPPLKKPFLTPLSCKPHHEPHLSFHHTFGITLVRQLAFASPFLAPICPSALERNCCPLAAPTSPAA